MRVPFLSKQQIFNSYTTTKNNTMIKQTFYMVWVEGANNPVFRHSTIEGAETEAKRLAEMTGSKAYVLCSIKSVELSKFKIEDCRPEGDDLPF